MRASTTSRFVMVFILVGCSADLHSGPAPDAGTTEPALQIDASFPEVIDLPNGFWPEGISGGPGTTFYVGSIATGAIFRGDARTGLGHLLVPAQPARGNAGLAYDARRDRLFVAGGVMGQLYVYDGTTGDQLAEYQLADPVTGPTLVNDIVVLRDAVYATDSFRPVLYRIPLGTHGSLPSAASVQAISLTGDFVFLPDAFLAGNANGIVGTPDEKQLLIVNTTTGQLVRVDPQTGRTRKVDLGSGSLIEGDGLLLFGRTLYAVQGALNQVAVVQLSPDFSRGIIARVITSAHLDFPSTIARMGNALYAVNARFDVAPGPDVAYQVVRLHW